MEKCKKPNFTQGDVDKAVNYHVLDNKLQKKDFQPPYCAAQSDPSNKIYVTKLCPRKQRVFACDLCNPYRKI